MRMSTTKTPTQQQNLMAQKSHVDLQDKFHSKSIGVFGAQLHEKDKFFPQIYPTENVKILTERRRSFHEAEMSR